MSHAWGQTVPSNYGRLPSSRQREFHSDVGAGDLIEKAIKEAGQKAIKEAKDELGELVSKQLTPELIEQAEKQTAKQLAGGSGETAEVLLKKNLKELAEESSGKVGKDTAKDITAAAAREGTQDNIDNLLKNAPETVLERQQKTGRDCDEKAVEAGYEPGTQEYTDNVSKCQETAVENMAFLGKAITYGGLGIGALVAVSILGKLGIFKGSKSSSDDEE